MRIAAPRKEASKIRAVARRAIRTSGFIVIMALFSRTETKLFPNHQRPGMI